MEKMGEQERREAETQLEKQARAMYVQELADENDAWITPVDAARITGVSESMAHRWVTSGRLPIKGDPVTLQPDLVGNPPRTRQVRLSDVAKIHPLLYPEQSIRPAIRTLDLQSIPLEIARITRENEHLTTVHQQMMGQLSGLKTAVEEGDALLHEEIVQQAGRMQHDFSTLRSDTRRMVSEVEERFEVDQQQFRLDVERLQSESQEMERRYESGMETLRTELIDAHEEQKGHIQHSFESFTAALQQEWQIYQQTVNSRLKLIEQNVAFHFSELEQRHVQELSTLKEQITALGQQVAHATETFEEQFSTITDRLTFLQQELERRQAEEQQRITHSENLAQSMNEQLSQYEQIKPLLPLVAEIQLLLAERPAKRNET